MEWTEIIKLAVAVIFALIAAYQTYKKYKADKSKSDAETVTKTMLDFVENLDKHFVKGTAVPTDAPEVLETKQKEGEVTKHLVKGLIEKHAVKLGVNGLIESALDKFIR